MFLKASSVFLVAVAGWWGRAVNGVATQRRGSALVRETLGLALRERSKMRAVVCPTRQCFKWTTKEGDDHYRVPYVHGGEALSAQQLADFKWVVEFFGRFTNLKFVERGAEETDKYVEMYKDSKQHCGMQGWKLSRGTFFAAGKVGDYCMTTGGISQVLMEALGFYYEHQRPDRDDYVTVQNTCDLYFSVKWGKSVNSSTPYDFASVLQLPPKDPNWFTCPPDEVSFAAKNKTLQPVLEADKMAPSACDLAALAELYPGPVAAPKCVLHKMPRICEPVQDCEAILGMDEAACREECKMRCQRNIAPASTRPACRLLSVEEIDYEPTTVSEVPGSLPNGPPGGAPAPPPGPASSASSPRCAAVHFLPAAAVLLGVAAAAALPL